MEKDNMILKKSKRFAVRIIRLYQYLCDEKKEFVLSKQLLRSGTSIGANIREAVRGQSRPDFIFKLCISLKEASESEYWLELLYETGYITQSEFNSIYPECKELVKILTAIIITAKKKEEQKEKEK